MQNIPFQNVCSQHKIVVSLYASFHAFYAFMLTVLMLNKFTYSFEHTFNRRNQDYG